MSKIRVHELAKELGKSSKDVIYALKGHGIDVESHMSTITSDSADKIRKYLLLIGLQSRIANLLGREVIMDMESSA